MRVCMVTVSFGLLKPRIRLVIRLEAKLVERSWEVLIFDAFGIPPILPIPTASLVSVDWSGKISNMFARSLYHQLFGGYFLWN